MFGYDRDELVGQLVEVLLPVDAREVHVQHRKSYVAAPRMRSMGSGLDLRARRKDGSEFPIEVGLSHMTLDDGSSIIISSIVDITVRHEMSALLEQKVQARTVEIERRRRIADGLRGILTVLNSDRPLQEILDYIVAQAVDLFAKTEACAIYKLDQDADNFALQTSVGLPERFLSLGNVTLGDGAISEAVSSRQPVAIPNIENALHDISSRSYERRSVLADEGFKAVLIVPLLLKDDIYGGVGFFYTEPIQFTDEDYDLAMTFSDQAALAIENARLRTQAEKSAVAAERDRLARDLHDSVTQTLFSASVIADVLPRLWERNRDEGMRRSGELRELTRGALAEMRTLLLELRPAKLVEIPLADLLQQLTEAVVGRTRIPIELEVNGSCPPLPPDVQIACYRVAQEALNNVAKHARASSASITLDCEPHSIILTVRDDGQGFEFDWIKPKNLGLTIMKERAESIDAQLSIDSQPGEGTQVNFVWNNGVHSE